jgi:hypothetical protein
MAFTVSGSGPLAESLRVRAGNISMSDKALCPKRRGRPWRYRPALPFKGGRVLRRYRRRIRIQAVPIGTVHRGKSGGYGTGTKDNACEKAAYPEGWRLWREKVTVSKVGKR